MVYARDESGTDYNGRGSAFFSSRHIEHDDQPNRKRGPVMGTTSYVSTGESDSGRHQVAIQAASMDRAAAMNRGSILNDGCCTDCVAGTILLAVPTSEIEMPPDRVGRSVSPMTKHTILFQRTLN